MAAFWGSGHALVWPGVSAVHASCGKGRAIGTTADAGIAG